ncbi:hypothetical protein METBIDRAFT_29522 [Metschnikowia bicuspidata var. bicuspidata NRRL YB-4993]|uniref:Uncharacterized protein n=1 Tax=Metschnikowia bicuspidata var. bicuspidata NRRL YB-4993 TaxID=869754 RepID=A0A1A0HFN7_9ASCO|nr:hypothetical protein METBIDRAFT_29522 [Metschnikowia bicuspidata var. bicuspidata NRRL YB-4993]OBA22969.1 hypothetical protein METBIDRAFT_29522 [Metschnikowia bicuspidata var. bicuspidata NRRL YB-4993]
MNWLTARKNVEFDFILSNSFSDLQKTHDIVSACRESVDTLIKDIVVKVANYRADRG